MPIRLDNDHVCSVVIVCTDHDYWSAIRFTMDEAHVCAETHESLFHPGEDTAGRAARMFRARQRRAADSSDVPG